MSASLVALCAATAHAQTPSVASQPGNSVQGSSLARPETSPTTETAQTAPASGAQPGTELQEVVVTATKVKTDVQKTPIAITSISGADLVRAGVTNPQELNKLVPSLQIEQNGAGSSIFIRGVGSRVLSSTQDPAVAFSVDGVYYSRTTGPSADFFDLSRVEVVEGPQGTLYGRNSTGGAVNLISNRPSFQRPSLDMTAEIGDYDTVRVQAAVNAPINDKLAIRLAVQHASHDGYFNDGYNDEKTDALRASLLWKPTSKLSVYLSGDYAHQGGQGAGTVPIGPGGNNNALTTRFADPNNPYAGPSSAAVSGVLQAAAPASAIPVPFPGTYCIGIPFSLGAPATSAAGTPAILTCSYPLGVPNIKPDGQLNNDYFGANLTVEDDLGFADLTAIAGYRGTRVNTFFRVDPTSQQQDTDADQGSIEVRLSSHPGPSPLKWLIGGFYLREQQSASTSVADDNQAISNPIAAPGSPLPATTCLGPFDPDGPGPAPAAPGVCLASAGIIQNHFNVVTPTLIDETYSGFGQATYSIEPWLRVTGGIRYTYENKLEKDGSITDVYTAPAGVSVTFPSVGNVSFSNRSYRAGLEWDVAPRSMAYFSYTTGFHAGGFNLGVQQGPNTYIYHPETVTNYAIGLKNRFFNNRLQLNVEGFWLDYDNYQVQSLGRVNDGSMACSVLDIEESCPFTLRTDNAATARVRGVETNLVWRVFSHGTLDANVLYNDATFTSFKVADPFTGALTDYSGATLPGVSKWTISTGYTHEIPLRNGGKVVGEIRTQYKDDTWMWYIHVPGNFQKGYTRTDLNLTYQAPNDRWSITGYVRNVENKATLLQGSPPEPVTGLPWNNLNPPRTFGVILGIHL